MAKSYTQITRKTPDLSVVQADWNTSVVGNINNLMIPPACNVYNTTDLSVNSATWTTVTHNSERFDTDTLHSTSTNTGRITIGTAGKYLFVANGAFANNATGSRYMQILKNGTLAIAYDNQEVSSAGDWTQMQVNAMWNCAVNDYFEVRVYQTSGGALSWYGSGTFEAVGFAACFMGLEN